MSFPSALARVYVVSLLGACGSPLPPGAEPAPRSDLTPPAAAAEQPCGARFTPRPELRAAVEEAAARWTVATGCDITTGEGGVPVELASTLPYGEGGKEVPGWTRDDLGLVLIHWRTTEDQRWRTVPHELGHALGGLHTETDGVLSGYPRRRDIIDRAALGTVCARLACRSFSPEEP